MVLKKYQVPGTVPSGKPPKSEPYRTMQWKSANRGKICAIKMAAAWGLQTKLATWSRTTVTMLLSGGDTAVGSEGKKLVMSWEQREYDSSFVCVRDAWMAVISVCCG